MRIVFVSHRWMFGGGEEDTFDKAKMLALQGHDVAWLCFSTSQLSEEINTVSQTTVVPVDASHSIRRVLSPTYTEPEELHRIVANQEPDVAIVIGRLVLDMRGYGGKWIAIHHFWTGLLKLDERHGNKYLPAAGHPIHTETSSCTALPPLGCDATVVVSHFMQRVLLVSGRVVPRCIFPSSGCASISTRPYEPLERPWVSVLSGHSLKNGKLLPELIARSRQLPIRVYLTEMDQDAQFSTRLLQSVCSRNSGTDTAADVQLLSRTSDVRGVYDTSRMVLCLSVVGETFGRVAAEAIASGVPAVLSSLGGNLVHIGEGVCPFVNPEASDAKHAVDIITDLYNNADRLRSISKTQLHRAREFEQDATSLNTLLTDVVGDARVDVMLIVPWHDQGLGMQARQYARVLESANISTCVFSFASYMAETTVRRIYQADPAEWRHPRVYYSPHIREHVTDAELEAFVATYRPRCALLPETCWNRVFEIAEVVKKCGVRVFAVPNIELVRREECVKHRVFDGLLANNTMSEKILWENMDVPVHLLGYPGGLPDGSTPVLSPAARAPQTPRVQPGRTIIQGLRATAPPARAHLLRRMSDPRPAQVTGSAETAAEIRCVLIGGYGLDVRKQGACIVSAFSRAFELCRTFPHAQQLRLHVTSQTDSPETEAAIAAMGERASTHFTYSKGNATMRDIAAVLANSDVSILVSRHEGLGLGFYEAKQHGCKVLTLDAPPFNETMTPGEGWFLPCTEIPNRQNDASLISSQLVDFDALTKWFMDCLLHKVKGPVNMRANEQRVYLQAQAEARRRVFLDTISRVCLNRGKTL